MDGCCSPIRTCGGTVSAQVRMVSGSVAFGSISPVPFLFSRPITFVAVLFGAYASGYSVVPPTRPYMHVPLA